MDKNKDNLLSDESILDDHSELDLSAIPNQEQVNELEVIYDETVATEQQALIKYLENPVLYLDRSFKFLLQDMLISRNITVNHDSLSFEDCFDLLFPKAYSNGTKISKIKEDGTRYLHIGVHDIPREYLLNYLITDSTVKLPFNKRFSADSGQLSCTVAKQKVFFHQSWGQLDFQSKFYFKKELIGSDRYYTVKPLVDRVGNKFCMISKTYRDIQELPRDNLSVLQRTGLYFSTTMFRLHHFNIKKIEIMPYQGISLEQFLRSELDVNEEDLLQVSLLVLKEFKKQIVDKNIVHTDIKLENICIIKEEDVFKLSFIDFEEAYLEGETPYGFGTAGYTPPECFKISKNHLNQLLLRERGQKVWLNSLKDNFKEFFTYEADCYAIGCILNQLLINTHFYGEIEAQISIFMHEDPSCRPKKEDLPSIIDLFHTKYEQLVAQNQTLRTPISFSR